MQGQLLDPYAATTKIEQRSTSSCSTPAELQMMQDRLMYMDEAIAVIKKIAVEYDKEEIWGAAEALGIDV